MKKLTTILLLAAAQIFAAGAIAAGTISTKIISPKGATNLAVFEGDTITLEAEAECISYSDTAGYFVWFVSTDGKNWTPEYEVKDLKIASSHQYLYQYRDLYALEIKELKKSMKFKA